MLGIDPGLGVGSTPKELLCELIQASGSQWEQVMLFSLPLGLSALRSSVLSQPVGQMKETMCLNLGGTHTG